METKPKNIFEAIFYGVEVANENLHTLAENLNDMFNKVVEMQNRVDDMLAALNQPAPEKPNAHGEEGVVEVSSEQVK